MDDDDFIVLRPSHGNAEDGKKLAEALHAHLALERQRIFRDVLVHALVPLGVAVWPLAAWPATFSPPVRGFVLSLFAMTFALLLFGCWKEHVMRRELGRLAAELNGVNSMDPK